MKKTIHVLLFLSILILFLMPARAQYYSSGADPASISWQQINTNRFRLVFPTDFSTPAKELAHYLDSVAPLIEATLEHKPRKIDILIHGHTIYSNGFVSWAPRRIEFYPNPSQDNYSSDWLKHLALHEYRHVVQIDKLRRGYIKVASWITGQQAVGAALGLYLPMWFIEGDAVITETTLSQSGRGRIPAFTQPLRAQLTEYGRNSYSKAYLGSYKDFVPDYYKMGYHLTAEIRSRYGPDIWSDMLKNVGRSTWSFTPFRKELKKTGYKNPKKLYNAVFDSLATQWQQYDDTLKTSEYTLIAKGEDDYTNLEYPAVTGDGHIFAQVSGPGQRQRIVEIPEPGKEPKTIAYTGYREKEPISANERWVAWAESKSHIRWPNGDYSVIRLHDRHQDKTFTLSHNSRFFSPALAPQSEVMAVVETSTSYEFFITLINVKTGETIQRIPTPQNAFPSHPAWTDVENELIMILQNNSGKRIVTLNTKNQQWKTLRHSSYDEPAYPHKKNNHIWFTASTRQSEEIFRMHLPSATMHQVTKARFGATSPSLLPNDTTVIYANYTPKGYQIVSAKAFQTEKENVSPSDLTNNLVKKLTQQEPDISTPEQADEFKIEPYSKWNLINIHSWTPAHYTMDNWQVSPGITLLSQNLLGTAIARAGYNASPSKSREKYNIGLSYKAWFPVIDFNVKWGDYKEEFNDVYNNNLDIFTIEQTGKERHIRLETGMRVPLNLSSGKWNRLLQPRSYLSWQNIRNINYNQTILARTQNNDLIATGETRQISSPDVDYWGMNYGLYYHNRLRGTSRDVGTRLGYSANIFYKHTPWGNYNAGEAFAISSRLFLPGFGKHDAISIENSWQTKKPGDEITSPNNQYRTYQRFNDMLNLPRGYNHIYNDDLYVFRGAYQMPLWNSDLAIGGLAYIKRFRLNLFFDSAFSKYQRNLNTEWNESITGYGSESGTYEYGVSGDALSKEVKQSYISTGMEIMTDLHALRFVLPFSVGYRGGYRDADNTFFHEAVLSTSFDSFLVQ